MANPKQNTLKLTEAEVRAEVKKIQESRATAKARRDSPEGKAKAKEQREAAAAKRKLVLAEAAKLGLKV